MDVNIRNSISQFFPSPSLEMVYLEAVANALDANATEVSIKIVIKSFGEPESLIITITDNGCGFTDERFNRFCCLLDPADKEHRGLGRLIYLEYFNKVEFQSYYEATNKREFCFTEDFMKESAVSISPAGNLGTTLTMTGYTKSKVNQYSYLLPKEIHKTLLEHFLPSFYLLKSNGVPFSIHTSLEVEAPSSDHDFNSQDDSFNVSTLVDMDTKNLDNQYLGGMYDRAFSLDYLVKPNSVNPLLLTAVSVDGRTIKMGLFDKTSIPSDYDIIFLLRSSFFVNKSNPSRQELKFDQKTIKQLKTFFGNEASKVLKEQIPAVVEKNQHAIENMQSRYPHLIGYIAEDSLGLIDETQSIENAQLSFFCDQKSVFDADTITEEVYNTSIDLIGRTLIEYILYRNLIIKKLKATDPSDKEKKIHDIVVPSRTTFKQTGFMQDLFCNNAWLFDDRYMNYQTILSDQDISRLILEIDPDAVDNDHQRPDIAVILSNELDSAEMKDVVIVELKRKGIDYKDSADVIHQLRQRARKLLKYKKSSVNRIWLYGIVEFDEELLLDLSGDDWIRLYSQGDVFYKGYNEHEDGLDSRRVPIGLFLHSYDSIWADAQSRNEVFLRIAKETLKNKHNPS